MAWRQILARGFLGSLLVVGLGFSAWGWISAAQEHGWHIVWIPLVGLAFVAVVFWSLRNL